jgi:hypothetical protein
MNVKKILRIQIVVAGLGTALFLAGPVRAESNIQTKDASQSTISDINQVTEEEAAPASLTMESGLLLLTLLVGTGLIFLYSRAATRSDRQRTLRQEPRYDIGSRVREFSPTAERS